MKLPSKHNFVTLLLNYDCDIPAPLKYINLFQLAALFVMPRTSELIVS